MACLKIALMMVFVYFCRKGAEVEGAFGMDPGRTVRLSPENFRHLMLRHRNTQIWIDPSHKNRGTYTKDSTFKIVAGLAGTGISLQSVNYPDRYFRHRGWNCWIEKSNGSPLFNKDASFYVRKGFYGHGTISLESVNYPHHYVRHSWGRVRISRGSGSILFKRDASWIPKLGPKPATQTSYTTSWEWVSANEQEQEPYVKEQEENDEFAEE